MKLLASREFSNDGHYKEKRRGGFGGPPKFFRVALSHDSLENYYKTNFAMRQHHKYNLEEIENMMPWEREIYVGLLMKFIEEENEKVKEQNKKRG